VGIPYQRHALPGYRPVLNSRERFRDAFGFVPFPGGDLWLAAALALVGRLVPKRHFQRSEERCEKFFVARAQGSYVLEGPKRSIMFVLFLSLRFQLHIPRHDS
jgi:hypothetical protein